MPLPEKTLERNYALLEAAAAAGERCPQSKPFGPLDPSAPSQLARLGRIRIELFMHNYRVVTIMGGPHAGKQTRQPPPSAKGQRLQPYKTIYKDHVIMKHAQRARASAAPVTLAPIKMREIPE